MSRKHWLILVAVVLAGVAAPALLWSFQDEYTYARIATGYAAKQTCSCVHVSGRALESCLADFPENAGGALSVVQDGATVRASVLFGAVRAEAAYEEGFGCELVD